jgi:hypothetical protein
MSAAIPLRAFLPLGFPCPSAGNAEEARGSAIRCADPAEATWRDLHALASGRPAPHARRPLPLAPPRPLG